MKKLLSFMLAALMLVPCAVTAFAEDAAPATGLVLAEGAHIVLDTESGYVDKIDGTITVGELKANFAGEVDIAGKADDAAVATDDVITAGGATIKALIYGDVDRNGKIVLGDATAMLKKIAGWEVDMNEDAADVDKTGDVNLSDVSKLLKWIAGWYDISLGNVRMVFENKKVTAEAEDDNLDLFFTSIMNKISVSETENTGEYSYKIKLAKNESDSCQALLYSAAAREGLSAELTPFVSEFGDSEMESKLEWVKYYNTTVFTQVNPWYTGRNEDSAKTDEFPEVLMSMADTFELRENKLQHFVITATSTKDTPAGMYTATLNIKDGEKVIKTATVYAYVWDFTVPDTPYSASLFNGSKNVENYEFMLDNNLSSYVLPYEIDTPEAQAYMSDPRVTAFTIAGMWDKYGALMGESDEDTKKYYEIVKSNPEWFKKGLFYYTDEPYGEGLFDVKASYEYLVDLLGINDLSEIRNMTPFGQSYPNAEYQNQAIDSVEFIKDYINVWVPISTAYHRVAEGGNWTPRYVLSKRGEYYERVEAFRERGDDIWWYVCCAPEVPYANYFTCYQGVINRVLSWQQYFNDVDGVLYYMTLGGTITKYKFDIGNGDGVLAYNMDNWGREGYGPSWRMYQVRDGFDDFDYLRMAEEVAGRDAVMKIVEKTTTGMLQYTEDYRVLEAARDEVVKLILAAQEK